MWNYVKSLSTSWASQSNSNMRDSQHLTTPHGPASDLFIWSPRKCRRSTVFTSSAAVSEGKSWKILVGCTWLRMCGYCTASWNILIYLQFCIPIYTELKWDEQFGWHAVYGILKSITYYNIIRHYTTIITGQNWSHWSCKQLQACIAN